LHRLFDVRNTWTAVRDDDLQTHTTRLLQAAHARETTSTDGVAHHVARQLRDGGRNTALIDWTEAELARELACSLAGMDNVTLIPYLDFRIWLDAA
jgi:hypothetical protein